MKKLVGIICLLMIAQTSFAYIKEGETANIQNLQGNNYSQATLKIMDMEQKRLSKEGNPYNLYYKDRYYAPKTVGWWYERLKAHFDPAQDDQLFGRHEVVFDNKFFQDQPSATFIEDL